MGKNRENFELWQPGQIGKQARPDATPRTRTTDLFLFYFTILSIFK